MDTRRIMQEIGITDEELISHWKAHDAFSRIGSETALKGLSDDSRNRAMKFYRTLREAGILPYKPVEGKMRFYITADYYECWKHILTNTKDRPEWKYLSLEDVKKMVKNSVDEVKKNMKHRPKLWEDEDQKVKTPERIASHINKFSKKELEEPIPF